jgi:large repetitive protein
LELEGVSFLEFQNMEVTIFDRYGRLLKSYYGPLNRKNGEGWDGTYQGTKLPTGDYWYKVKLNNKEGSVLVGNFTLYRK